jgi:NAD(P)-dependent dehydrogenase (short-subunit alcohol dehydrogenase family)
MSGSLEGRTAIVTGASRGMGLAIAEALAAEGAAVVMSGRDSGRGEAAAGAARAKGGDARFVVADQGSAEDWSRLVTETERSHGRLDILVLNAGVSELASTVDLELEDFRRVCRTNLKGPFLGLKAGVAAMRRGGRGGSVVVVGSIAAKIGVADHIHYTASKSGVAMLVKAAALELGPEKIRVNAIHPGFVDTGMTERFPDEAKRAAPLGRPGEAAEIAAAALYLASDRSAFMTGAEIVLDGGWTAR